jgi:hypothetical protein
MLEGDVSKDKMSRKKMAKSKSSTKMKKTDDKMQSVPRSLRTASGGLFCLPDYLSLRTHGSLSYVTTAPNKIQFNDVRRLRT